MMNSSRVVPEWKYVEKYLEKENVEGSTLALFEANKIFERIAITKKGSKKIKDTETSIVGTIRELKNPEPLLKARETVKDMQTTIGGPLLDLYGAQSMVETYRDAIREILFDDIDDVYQHSWKYVLWPAYCRLFWSRKRITRILIWFLFFVALILFIADTDMGRSIFDVVVSQIHLILRFLIIAIVSLLLVVFVLASFVVFLDSRRTKRRRNK